MPRSSFFETRVAFDEHNSQRNQPTNQNSIYFNDLSCNLVCRSNVKKKSASNSHIIYVYRINIYIYSMCNPLMQLGTAHRMVFWLNVARNAICLSMPFWFFFSHFSLGSRFLTHFIRFALAKLVVYILKTCWFVSLAETFLLCSFFMWTTEKRKK